MAFHTSKLSRNIIETAKARRDALDMLVPKRLSNEHVYSGIFDDIDRVLFGG